MSTSIVWLRAPNVPWAARVLVLDTNFLATMAWSAADRRDRPCDLEAVLNASRVTAFAGAHVPDEMLRRVSKLHPERDPGPALQAWRTRLAPRIRIVDLPTRWFLDPGLQPVLEGDSDDAPTAALAAFLSPAVLLSADKVFEKAGLPLPADPRLAVRAVLMACEQEDMALVAAMCGLGLVQATWAGIEALGRAARRDPQTSILLAALLGVGLLFAENARPGTARLVGARTLAMLRSAGSFTVDASGHVLEERRTVTAGIIEVHRQRPHEVEEAIAAILARNGSPMSVLKLREQLERSATGYGSPVPHWLSRAALTEALRGCEAFSHDHRGWSLGRISEGSVNAPESCARKQLARALST